MGAGDPPAGSGLFLSPVIPRKECVTRSRAREVGGRMLGSSVSVGICDGARVVNWGGRGTLDRRGVESFDCCKEEGCLPCFLVFLVAVGEVWDDAGGM